MQDIVHPRCLSCHHWNTAIHLFNSALVQQQGCRAFRSVLFCLTWRVQHSRVPSMRRGKTLDERDSLSPAVKTALAVGPDSRRKELEGAIMPSPNIRPQGVLSQLHMVLKNGRGPTQVARCGWLGGQPRAAPDYKYAYLLPRS